MAITLVMDHLINADLKNAKAVFADLRKFSEFHPLFVGIEQTGVNHFIVRERMPFGPVKFRYKAEVIDKTEANEIIYIAHPFFIVLTITFSFSGGENNRTKLKEHIHIKGPALFTAILKNLIKKMHPLLIKGMNDRFQSFNG